MTKTIQLLRGTTAQNAAFTGASGELTVDTQTHELRVHDGSTVGGHIIYTKSDVDTALSSKADAATTYTKSDVDTALATKANTDLSNLTSTAQNISNWSSNVTNCITEIPQDIKLELSSGTLTLKAGSKVYVPNGVGVFDTVTIANDISVGCGGTGQVMLFYNSTNNTAWANNGLAFCLSGTSVPSAFTGMFYKTDTNNIDYYSNSTAEGNKYSFPLAIITVSSNTPVSIDRIFNGFGYIGSTVFALPGVSGLAPNGRNADGTLKTTKITTTSVITRSDMGTGNNAYCASIKNDLTIQWDNNYHYSNEGFLLDHTGSTFNGFAFAIYSTDSNKKITKFLIKDAFHSIDASETDFISHQAFPGTKLVNLGNVGASGTGYIAPADGYFALAAAFSVASNIYMYDNNPRYGITLPYAANTWTDIYIPVSKGQQIYIQYGGTATTYGFFFIYANGAS